MVGFIYTLLISSQSRSLLFRLISQKGSFMRILVYHIILCRPCCSFIPEKYSPIVMSSYAMSAATIIGFSVESSNFSSFISLFVANSTVMKHLKIVQYRFHSSRFLTEIQY